MSSVGRLAIVHYHLRGGGVTRVIAHAAEALARAGWQVRVLVGEKPRVPVEYDYQVVDSLGYDADRDQPVDPDQLLSDLTDAAGDVDLWHIHNHSLGKNAALPRVVRMLAEQGHRLVLQPHDFAEDGRPSNYQHLSQRDALDALYPVAEHIRYAFLNSRDRHALRDAGLIAAHAWPLPNAIDLQADEDEPVPDQPGRLFLYPTRAIRRKNLGELLLWAAASRNDEDRFAATLAPTSAVDIPIYEDFKALAGRLDLPMAFEIGSANDASFTALLKSAHALVTTSVAEGFGLAFLEPFLVNQSILGRDLPAISDDFRAEGIDLSSLYRRVEIPLDWLDAHALRRRIADQLARSYASYNQPCDDDHVQRAFHAAASGDTVDFARLDEPLQHQVIEHVHADSDAAELMQPHTLDTPLDPDVVAANRKLVLDRYSLESYADRLQKLYNEVLSASVGPVDALDPQNVLVQFLKPEQFYLLRS